MKAYLDYATTKDYYLASVANNIALDPYGMIIMPGLASQPIFYAGFFEKYGIGIQVTRVGKYKSYVEPFIRKDMSPENREQVQKLLDDVWGSLLSDIGKSRGLSTGRSRRPLTPRASSRRRPPLKSGLIDRVAYRDEIVDELKKETGVTSPTESFRQVPLGYYARSAVVAPAQVGRGKVAIVYAEGDIVEGEGDAQRHGRAPSLRARSGELREDSIGQRDRPARQQPGRQRHGRGDDPARAAPREAR